MNPDAYLTRAQVALVTGVKPSTISGWRSRGWIDGSGRRRHLTAKLQADGNLKYRLGDALEAERDTRRNPKSTRDVPRPSAPSREKPDGLSAHPHIDRDGNVLAHVRMAA